MKQKLTDDEDDDDGKDDDINPPHQISSACQRQSGDKCVLLALYCIDNIFLLVNLCNNTKQTTAVNTLAPLKVVSIESFICPVHWPVNGTICVLAVIRMNI